MTKLEKLKEQYTKLEAASWKIKDDTYRVVFYDTDGKVVHSYNRKSSAELLNDIIAAARSALDDSLILIEDEIAVESHKTGKNLGGY